MSVDVFGRTLKSEGIRGAPGAGYNFTDDGQFDLENKRLCNLSDPIQPEDAINLKFLKQLIESEVQSVNKVTLAVKKDIDNLYVLLKDIKEQIIPKIQNDMKNLNDILIISEVFKSPDHKYD